MSSGDGLHCQVLRREVRPSEPRLYFLLLHGLRRPYEPFHRPLLCSGGQLGVFLGMYIFSYFNPQCDITTKYIVTPDTKKRRQFSDESSTDDFDFAKSRHNKKWCVHELNIVGILSMLTVQCVFTIRCTTFSMKQYYQQERTYMNHLRCKYISVQCLPS